MHFRGILTKVAKDQYESRSEIYNFLFPLRSLRLCVRSICHFAQIFYVLSILFRHACRRWFGPRRHIPDSRGKRSSGSQRYGSGLFDMSFKTGFVVDIHGMMRLIILFVIVGIVNSLHKHFAVFNMIGKSRGQ